jgi:predicted chitinase
MDITLDQLRAIAPHAPDESLAPLNAAMSEANIDTPLRQAAFVAQVAHESNQFRQLVEDGDGWRYEGRHDLGNTVQGDGPRFRGRGYIQLTGRKNYTRASGVLGVDLVGKPELAATPQIAARVAAWYWSSRALNPLADNGDMLGITRAINGGLNGLEERLAFYRRACTALGAVLACSEPTR